MRSRRTVAAVALVLAAVVAVPLVVSAQRGGGGGFGRFFGGGGRGRNTVLLPNLPYDGRFTMVRIRYTSAGRWSADYPTMEQNLTEMLPELTPMDSAHLDGSNVYTLDDPELMNYPLAYLTEPGFWVPSDAEVLGLREYLAKGGFLIVDDFHYLNEWNVFERAIMRVLPDARIVPLDVSQPVFNAFFEIETLHVPYPSQFPGEQQLFGEFYGIFENNDPNGRLKVIISYNMDLGDYVEWAQSGRAYQFEPTNEAYKFMINYVIYGQIQ